MGNENEMVLYTDASFPTSQYENGEDYLYGMTAIACPDDDVMMVSLAKVPRQEDLKQYINIFEMKAINKALSYAFTRMADNAERSIRIITDSKVNVHWFEEMDEAGKTPLHLEIKQRQERMKTVINLKTNIEGVVSCKHIERDSNPAGKILEHTDNKAIIDIIK